MINRIACVMSGHEDVVIGRKPRYEFGVLAGNWKIVECKWCGSVRKVRA